MICRYFISFFLLLYCETILAQKHPAFYTRSYTTENGLPSNGIKGLQWDEEAGFLWIATEAGISRFNGLDFKNFTKDNTPIIGSERMLFLERNNAGKIYTADQSGNILAVNRNKLAFFSKYNNIPQKGFFGNLFTISVSDSFFYSRVKYLGQQPFTLMFDHVLPLTDTSCLIIYGGRIFKLSAGMQEAMPYTDSSFKAGTGFKIQNRCFAVDNGLNIHEINEDPSLNKVLPLINENGSRFDAFNSDARLFWINRMDHPVIVNGKNAWQFSLSGDKIVASLLCSDIPTDALIEYVQYSPKKKILFLGTDSKGIIVMNRNRLDPMKNAASGTNERNAYYAQVELPDGTVLTNEGHIIGTNINPAISPIKGSFTNYISVSNDSLLWFSQNNLAGLKFLHSYNQKTGKTTAYPKILGSDILVRTMTNGQLLLVTEFGIGWFTGDSIRYLYRHPVISYDNTIYDFTELQPGVILVAGCSGIYKFTLSSGKVDSVLKSDGYCVRSMWRYKDYIFFGTYGKGFFIWKNGLLKPMPLDKKKYLLYSHCFVPDEYGFCWISSNRGLFKANIDELINAYETNSPVVYYHYFGKTDGMDMIEMNGGCAPCALVLKNKTISFPTMDGLLWVNPLKAEPVLPDGQIFIDKIIADGIEIDPDKTEKILLPAKTDDISISFSFSAWCNKENIYIDYQLNDTLNWKPVNTDNEVLLQFNNLPSGNYTLRLRKLNGFGINNYSYKTIRFSIVTPWHKQWWFYILAALLVTGIVALYFRFRTNQFKIQQRKLERQVSEKTKELQDKNEILEKNNSIKTRLISIISHDIVTPLKFVTAAGKNLIEKRKLMPEELQQETIQEMTNTSQELHLLSTNILNWIKYQNENRRMTKEAFPLHELVKQVLGILNSLAHQKGLRIANEIDPNLTIFQFYEPLKILVYNLLTNAIHFSERGTITVRAALKQSNIFLSVQDEGAGMTPEKIQSLMQDHVVISSANVDNKKGHGLGFLIIKDLLKTIGASLHIESTVGVGSKISIVIPV